MSRLAPLGLLVFLIGALTPTESAAASRPPPVVGRWNLAVTAADGSTFPSWLELTFDTKTGKLEGRLCGRYGRPRPLAKAEWKKNELTLVESPADGGGGQDRIVTAQAPQIGKEAGKEAPPPPKAETGKDMGKPGAVATAPRTYKAKMRFGNLEGTAEAAGEPTWTIFGTRPPKFNERGRVAWGKPVPLVSRGLIGWRLRDSRHGTCWKETAGVLESRPDCVDIVSDGRYQDFKLHLEFKLAPGGASGVFLRGRYQVQLADDVGKAPTDETSGAIYGLISPRKNAAAKAGQWQTLDVTLVGRKVTVMLNGQLAIDNQEIVGPTGGAIDSDESIPGSVLLEAEKGPLAFRNLVVTPALW
jgi:hypothetical protein